MEKEYPPANQYPPPQPPEGAYPPADAYPPPAQYPPSAPYPAYQSQPPPYDPGYGQQQQANTVVVAATAQAPQTIVHSMTKPPNYIALSLINLLCCCWPLGIVGLIYSLKVDSEFAAGRYEEARQASDSARNINYVGIGIGTFLIIGYIIVIIVANVAAASS